MKTISQDDDNRFYTYQYRRSDMKDSQGNDAIFYIGKGTDNRIRAHIGCARRNQKCRHRTCAVIRKVIRNGGYITYEKICDNVSQASAFAVEILMIAVGRASGWPLVNIKKGGQGVGGVHKGRVKTVEEIERFRNSILLGYDLFPERRQFKSDMMKEIRQRPEVKEKHRLAALNPDTHEKRARVHRGKAYRAKTYPGFVAPDGTEYLNIHNLKVFALRHGLRPENMLQVHLGMKKSHQGWRKYPLTEEPERRTYFGAGFKSPDGTIYEGESILNLKKFSLQHNVEITAMSNINTGIIIEHRGWTRHPVLRKRQPQYIPPYAGNGFTSPSGQIFRAEDIVSLTDFCKEHSITAWQAMYRVSVGTKVSHLGWTRYPPLIAEETHYLISPSGNVEEITNIQVFCEKYGLMGQSVQRLLNGSIKTYKGWTLYEPQKVPRDIPLEAGVIPQVTQLTMF